MTEEETALPVFRRRHHRGERGQSLVEFALTLPLLCLLFLGMLETGHALNAYLTILNSARDGARLGSQGLATDAEIVSLVNTEAARILPGNLPQSCSGNNPQVCVTHPTVSSVTAVKVRVCYSHTPIVGIPVLMPNAINMCSATTMRVVS